MLNRVHDSTHLVVSQKHTIQHIYTMFGWRDYREDGKQWHDSTHLVVSQKHTIQHIYTMFGWRDYREDGKQWVENGVENSVFHCLGSEGKKRGRKTREKIFLPSPPIFFLPNQE